MLGIFYIKNIQYVDAPFPPWPSYTAKKAVEVSCSRFESVTCASSFLSLRPFVEALPTTRFLVRFASELEFLSTCSLVEFSDSDKDSVSFVISLGLLILNEVIL